MAVERAFVVKMVGDAQNLLKEFNKVRKDGESAFGGGGLGGKLSSLIPSFKTIAIAGAAAFGAVTAAAGFAIKAAAEDAESQARLAQALKNTFGESERLVAVTEELIGSMERQFAVEDTKLRPAMAQLVRATGDYAQSQKLLKIALDVSAGSGRDLESVTLALARASNGSVTALTRLGIPLDANAVKAKDFDAITRQLAQTFEGAAQASADSAAGKFRAFGIAVDNLKEQFGFILLPTVTKVIDVITKRLIPAVQLAIAQFQSGGIRSGLAYFVASFGDAGKAVIEMLRNISLAVVDMGGHVSKVAGALALALAPAIGFRNAMDLYSKAVNASASATSSINRTFDGFASSVTYASNKLSIIAQGPLDYVERRLSQTTRTAKGTKQSMEDLGEETEKAGKKAKKAGDDVKSFQDRLKEYTATAKSAKSASDAFKRSQDRVASSQLSVAEAEGALAKAEAELAAAQQGGTPEQIAEAQRKLAQAQRALARSQFNVETSVIAVRDAEKRLADVRADAGSTADEIRKAEIALEEAHFAVADAQDRLFDETNDLAEARRNLRIATTGLTQSDAELLPFQAAVREMQSRLADASKAHKEALEDETEALNDYRAALEALAAAAALVPKYSAVNPATGLVPIVPTPTGAGGFYSDQRTMPDTVNINVNSSVVNPAQVGQEIYEYLQDYSRVGGDLRFGNAIAI